MGQNISGHLNAMYQNILTGVTETLNQSTLPRKLFTEYPWHGSHIEHALHTKRGLAVKFGSDGSSFPTPHGQAYEKIKVGRKMMLGSISLTDAVLAAAAKSPEVAIDAMSAESEGIMNDIGVLDTFLSYRDGTGKLASVMESYAGGTPTLVEVDDARCLFPTVEYDLYSAAGVFRSVVKIKAVNSTTDANGYAQVYLETGTQDTAMVAGDGLYLKDSKDLAYTGLDGLIDDTITGTFQNVAMDTNRHWTSLVFDNSGVNRDLTPELLRNFIASVAQRSDDYLATEKEYVLLGSKFVSVVLDEMFQSALRLAPSDNTIGLKAPTFQTSNGKLVVQGHRLAPYHKLFMPEAGDLKRGYHKKLSWRLDGGQILNRSDNVSIYTGTLIEFAENFIIKRRGSGKLVDINETVLVSD